MRTTIQRAIRLLKRARPYLSAGVTDKILVQDISDFLNKVPEKTLQESNELAVERELLSSFIYESLNEMTTDKIIKQRQKDVLEKLHLFSVNGSLIPVLLMTSYCGDNPKCADANPCEDCLKMCNIAFIEKDAIKNVICGYDFLEDYR